MRWPWCAQTPARKSAWSSSRTEVVGFVAAHLLHHPLHLLADAELVLHVMADFVRDDVGLGEVPAPNRWRSMS